MIADKFKVGIIGGGSIATSFLYSIAEELVSLKQSKKIEIYLFDPNHELGPGCYLTRDVDSNLLNTRADTMSASPNDRMHFLNWLMDNEQKWRHKFPNLKISANTFLPRNLFGIYLSDVFKESLEKIKSLGIKVTHINDEVTDVLRMMNSMCLDTKSSGAFEVNYVVLSMGNLASTLFGNLQGIENYHMTPYPCIDLTRKIKKEDSVCVIGTSLSAIDSIISLAESGHKGKIVCVSRSGQFPSVRGELNQKIAKSGITQEKIAQLTATNGGKLSLDQIYELFVTEINRLSGSKFVLEDILNDGLSAYDYLTKEIELSTSIERDWQSVIYATNGVIDYIWNKLGDEDKRTFYKMYRSLWFRHRVSFPLQNAIKLKKLIKADQLTIISGFEDVKYIDDKNMFEISLNSYNKAFESVIYTKHVINATSYSHEVKNSKIPIVKNLLKRSFTSAHEFGGFNVDYQTGMLVYPNGTISQDFSVLGSMSNGTYIWTNAFDVNVRLAALQAKNLGVKISQHAFSKNRRASDRVSEIPANVIAEATRNFEKQSHVDLVN